MSPARKVVRERGAWRIAAVVAAILIATGPTAAAFNTPPALPLEPQRLVNTQKAKKTKKRKPDGATSIKDMIKDEFGKDADAAIRIAHCESKFDPDDVSTAGAVGVFQIRPSVHGWRVSEVKKGKSLTDPRTNIRVAHHIYKHQGWEPWVCARILGMTHGRAAGASNRPARNFYNPSTTDTRSYDSGRRYPAVPQEPQSGSIG